LFYSSTEITFIIDQRILPKEKLQRL